MLLLFCFAAWLIMGIIKGSVSFAYAWVLAWILYKTNIFTYGFYTLPFLFLLLLSGWWIGFLIASIIIRYGSRVQTLAWSVPWILAPFSAIYYPVEILPGWAQGIAQFLPTSYIFEGMRQVISTGVLDWNKVYISLLLNLVYLLITILILRKSFYALLKRGVVKLF